jgi:hypothetical protein
VAGEMNVYPNENSWHLATNFLVTAEENEGKENICWRYDFIKEQLSLTDGDITLSSAMDTLEQVSQEFSTQWSVVYDISTGEVSVVMGRNYDVVHTFQLHMVKP